MEGRVSWSPDDPDRFVRQIDRWSSIGATHIAIDTMHTSRQGVDEHLAALTTAAELVDVTSR
jgi:hypothetical protein